MRALALILFWGAATGQAVASSQSIEFCIGEVQSRCPASATWIRCAREIEPKPTVESAAREICSKSGAQYQYKNFEFVRQFGGNYCGYNIARAICELRSTSPAASSQPSQFVVAGAKIDQTMQAKSMFDLTADCGNNVACAAIARAISAYSGIPVDQMVTAAAKLDKFVEKESETSNFRLRLPSGYRYCSSTMKTVSIVPFEGPRGSLFSGRSQADGMSFQTWTPKMSDGSRSWVEASVSVVGVRADLAEQMYGNGKCKRPGSGDGRLIFHCRGGGCQSASDRGQSVSGVDPGPKGNAK